MTTRRTFVVLGAGLAGAKAAETLRAEGFNGRIVVVGEEDEHPYERPPLSKEYLRGESDRQKLFVHDESYYRGHDIELRTATRALTLDPDGHSLTLTSGGHTDELRYDRLLLTTGASPRRLEVPGADRRGVFTLRSVADADELAGAIRHASSVVVIGAGWIGTEVAASARQLGRDVAIVAPDRLPMQRVLGDEVGEVYRRLHTDHGVDFHLETNVSALLGTDAVEAVALGNGTRIAADVVVVGIGVKPRIEVAAAAGLAVDDGVVVDAHLRTSHPDVFAAGDVASAFHPLLGERIRVEHWANALYQGPAAARNMLDIPTPYERIPYFFSDQFDLGMEYSGHVSTWDRVVFRGDPADGRFLAFWIADGVVVAGMHANLWDEADAIQRLVRERVCVDPALLADPSTPLDALAGASDSAVV